MTFGLIFFCNILFYFILLFKIVCYCCILLDFRCYIIVKLITDWFIGWVFIVHCDDDNFILFYFIGFYYLLLD